MAEAEEPIDGVTLTETDTVKAALEELGRTRATVVIVLDASTMRPIKAAEVETLTALPEGDSLSTHLGDFSSIMATITDAAVQPVKSVAHVVHRGAVRQLVQFEYTSPQWTARASAMSDLIAGGEQFGPAGAGTTVCYHCPEAGGHTVSSEDVAGDDVLGSGRCPEHDVPLGERVPCK